jgi:hypothetical protein
MKRYYGEEFNTKNIAKVESIDIKNITPFFLSPRDIKHIRRCLHSRDLTKPAVYDNDDNLTKQLIRKFRRFGDLVPIRAKNKTIIIKNKDGSIKDRMCEYPGCKNTNVEIHHKEKIASGGDNHHTNIQYLCPKHHDLVELQYILTRKEAEIIKTRKRIETILQALKEEQNEISK